MFEIFVMVPSAGLEPARPKAVDPKSTVSAIPPPGRQMPRIPVKIARS